MTSNTYLRVTDILNFNHPDIQSLIDNQGWRELDDFHKIGQVYSFVKDQIAFGYNRSDDIAASDVLRDGYGQCNTKGTLLMALLRAVGIPCRFHGFTIEKSLQKGAIPHWLFPLTPKYIIHSWVEVLFEGKWLNLEGFIIDNDFLDVIQHKFAASAKNFCGYGVATKDLLNPEVEWQGKSTYIQKDGIHDDFGVFEQPDDFYQKHGTNLKGIKRLAYQYILRHLINRNVQRLRKHKQDTANPFPQSSS